MPIRLTRVLSVLCMLLCMSLLALLLAASTATTGEALRRIDVHAQYLENLSTALDEWLLQSSLRDAGQAAALDTLTQRIAASIAAIGDDLDAALHPATAIDRLQHAALTAFAYAGRHRTPASGEPAYAQLETAGARIAEQAAAFADSHGRYAAGLAYIDTDMSALVDRLRSAGRNDEADSVFRSADLMRQYLQSGESARLDQIADLSQRLERTARGLPSDERATIQRLVDRLPTLVEARRAMRDARVRMDLRGFDAQVARLREDNDAMLAHVLGLQTQARVLLNLYTVMLLMVLGWLGLRLRRSHAELGRSHEQLEVRVQQRTADLEQALDELKESQVQLVQAEKMSSIGQLVAGVMHEINTPLLYVLNNTTVTAEMVDEMREFVDLAAPVATADGVDELESALARLRRARQRLDPASLRANAAEVVSLSNDSIEGLEQISELVQSLKDFSRLDRAGEDRFDVRDGIDKTLTITRNLLKYGIEVRTEFEDVEDIFCSPSQINQVLINLVTNAVQAMDGQGVLTLRTRQLDGWIEVEVEDTGCGIPADQIDQIMDPFFTTKPVGQGTGLGLSIVRQIVDRHGGRIRVESRVGAGTRMVVTLPSGRARGEQAA